MDTPAVEFEIEQDDLQWLNEALNTTAASGSAAGADNTTRSAPARSLAEYAITKAAMQPSASACATSFGHGRASTIGATMNRQDPHRETIDLTIETPDERRSSIATPRPATARNRSDRASATTTDPSDAPLGAGKAPSRKRKASSPTAREAARPHRQWAPDTRCNGMNAERLRAFRAQIRVAGYDALRNLPRPITMSKVQAFFNDRNVLLDPKLDARAAPEAVLTFLFEGIYDVKPCSANQAVTAAGILEHLDGLPAPDRQAIHSWFDIALSLANGGKRTTYTSIRNAMAQRRDMDRLLVLGPGQPPDKATLAALLNPPDRPPRSLNSGQAQPPANAPS